MKSALGGVYSILPVVGLTVALPSLGSNVDVMIVGVVRVWPSGLVSSLERTLIGTAESVETMATISSFAMRGTEVGLDDGELVGCY